MTISSVPASGVESVDHVVLRAAVAAYLGRYRGESRLHTESDLRVFRRWCADQDLDPLAAVRAAKTPGPPGYGGWRTEVDSWGYIVPRPERTVDPSAGPVQRFATDLRKLREKAGNPAYRTLAKRCGYSVTSLSDAAGGRRLPALAVVRAFVEACDGDPDEWDVRWRQVCAELAQSRDKESGATEQPPYLGLASFQPADAGRFFGRERLVEELAGRLSRGGFSALVGASGSGKSSLLRAGLLPALAGTGRYLLFTPGTGPLDALAGAGPPAPLVLVDQFEEVFTLCREEADRARFVDTLLNLADRGASTVVIALRADFYGHCAAYPRLAAALRGATELIGPMCDEELARAVTRPAGLVGLSVERALVTKVVADAAGRPGALPMVSHALLETWRQRQGAMLTLAGFEAAGGVTGAVARTAETVYRGFDEARRTVARQVLTRLTTLGEGTEDTRRRVARAELDFPGADEVVERLAHARLVVVDEHTVEVAHEALIAQWPRLRGWLTEDRQALRVHRQLTDAAAIWQGLDRESGALYRGARLATVREWSDCDDHAGTLTRLEREFLAASVAAETAEHAAAERRSAHLRRLTAALAALLAVALVGGATAVWQWREAAGQREQARSRQLAAEALSVAPADVARALRLSLDAYRTAPTTEALGAVLSLASSRQYSARLHPDGRLVKDVAFSPDGSTLAVAAQDGRLTLWDVASRTRRGVLTGHDGAVRAVAYQPGGALLASGGRDGTVIIWDVGRGAVRAQLRGHTGFVDGVAFSPDGTTLASIGVDYRILLWRVRDGAALGELTGHGGDVSDVRFTPDGRWLVSAGDDGTAVVWDVAKRTRLRILRAGGRPVYAVAVSPDGRYIATGGEDRDISVWDAATGRLTASLLGHTSAVSALAFAPDSVTLVSGGYDNVVNVWDIVRGERTAVLRGHTSQLYGVAISPDGRTIAAASRDQTVQVWSLDRLPFAGSTAEVGDLQVSPDGRTIAATGTDRTTVLWDTATRRQRRVLTADDPAGSGTAELAGQLFVTNDEKYAIVWDATRAEPVRRFTGHTDRLLDAVLDPYRRLVATGGADRKVLVWDLRSGRRVAVLDQSAAVQWLVFTDDGSTLVVIARDGTVTFWDAGRRSTRNVLRTGVAANAAAVRGDLLALGSATGEITLWNLARGTRLARLTGHSGPVTALAFDPTGTRLASGGQDKTARLWDVPPRRLSATLVGHEATVTTAAWSPDGDLLYTGGQDHKVIPWTVSPARALTGICHDLRVDFPDQPAVRCPR
jgi:WD40 repeat protein